MLDRTWSEVMLYERVVKNWPLFGPHLEAALCDVLRTINGSLNRICANASNAALTGAGAGGPQGQAGGAAGPGERPLGVWDAMRYLGWVFHARVLHSIA